MAIGIGIGIPFKKQSGLLSSYWATRTPTGLTLAIASDSQINVTWTDGAEASDGLKIYLSTDGGVTYAYNSTIAFGTQAKSLTGLSTDTLYTVKLVAYKDANESTPITASAITYLTGTPVTYGANPLPIPDDMSMFRNTLLVGSTYHIFEEYTYGAALWYIRKRTSTDGINIISAASARLFDVGGGGEFDEKGQADVTVIYDGAGDWKMWFDAKNGANVWDKIGYATSVDGTTWTKVGSILERGAGGTWDDASVHHPACVKHNGVYYLFYSGDDDINYDVKNIGLATSTNLVNWTKHASNPLISIGAGGQWDDTYIRPSRPVLIYGLWYMWYWGYDGSTTQQMGLATSPDLITWTKRGVKYAPTGGIEATDALLKVGTNPKDFIIKQWFVASDYTLNLNTITLQSLLSKLTFYNKTTHGDSVTNGSSQQYAANYIYFCRVTVASESLPFKATVYINSTNKSTSGTEYIKAALYANGVDTPTTLLAISNQKAWNTVTGNAWADFNFTTKPTLPAGDYWLAFWSSANFNRNLAGGGTNNWGWQSLAYGTFPNPAVAGSIEAHDDFDAYLTAIPTYSQPATNRHSVALTPEPSHVYFNNVAGTKKSSVAEVTSEYDWFWDSDVLTIYSDEHPDLRYQISYD